MVPLNTKSALHLQLFSEAKLTKLAVLAFVLGSVCFSFTLVECSEDVSQVGQHLRRLSGCQVNHESFCSGCSSKGFDMMWPGVKL